MKKLNTHICISILLFVTNMAKAQEIKDNTLFLFIQYHMQPPPNDKSGYIDTLKVTYSNQDTIAFNSNRATFIKEGERFSLLDSSEKVLLYDYSLNEGDTFVLDYLSEHSFLVDSVVNVLYEDGNYYTEWHLHDLEQPTYSIVWVKNLGEKNMGWNWSDYTISHFPGTKAICSNGDLVYWRTSNDFSPNPEPSPNCNFDSLISLLSPFQPTTFFIDGSVYRSHIAYISLSPPSSSFDFFVKETIYFDSSSINGEYYSVSRNRIEGSFSDTNNYNLRVLNDSVYFSGKISDFSTTIVDSLIYDFNIQLGDTFQPLNTKLDSIVNITFLDNVSRQTLFFGSYHFLDGPFRIIKGLGTNTGLVPHFGFNAIHQTLVSVCNNQDLIYFNNLYDTLGVTNFCEDDSVQKVITEISRVSVKEIKHNPIKIYPNPATTELFVEQISLGSVYRILNIVGAEVAHGVYEGGTIPISELGQGIYILQIQTNEQIRQARFIKE